MGEPQDPKAEVMTLLRELTKSQVQLKNTMVKGERKWLMEEIVEIRREDKRRAKLAWQ